MDVQVSGDIEEWKEMRSRRRIEERRKNYDRVRIRRGTKIKVENVNEK
jgi:hypothetical protein